MTNAILMLNDSCFLKIFKHLSLHDLANVKEAFKCLDAATDMAFKRMTDGTLLFQSNSDFYDKYDPETSKQIMKQFGSSVHTLNISYLSVRQTKWKEIFSTVNEHCKEKLTNLSLIGECIGLITKTDASLVIDVLKNVETIELSSDAYEPHSSEFLELLCHCEKVKTIKLSDRIDTDIHKTIFRKNINLLKLRWCGGLKDSDTKTIVDNLMNTQLEEMSIYLPCDTFCESFAELKRLNYLKHLQIDVGYVEDITPFLLIVDTFDSLESLTLSTRLNDQAIAILARMTKLKILKLDPCILRVDSPFKSLLVLCGNTCLEHLIFLCHITPFNRIDEANFLELIEKRIASTSKKCFHLILNPTVYAASLEAIPFELLEANKETIKIIDLSLCHFLCSFLLDLVGLN